MSSWPGSGNIANDCRPTSASTASKPTNATAEAFFDTNILLYLLSADPVKANRAEAVLAEGGVISVQVLNEFTAVAVRKLGMSYPEIRDALEPVRQICTVVPLNPEIQDLGLALAERYGFSIYGAMIVASALGAGCETLYSEGLQDRQRIGEWLVVKNPFAERS